MNVRKTYSIAGKSSERALRLRDVRSDRLQALLPAAGRSGPRDRPTAGGARHRQSSVTLPGLVAVRAGCPRLLVLERVRPSPGGAEAKGVRMAPNRWRHLRSDDSSRRIGAARPTRVCARAAILAIGQRDYGTTCSSTAKSPGFQAWAMM